MGWTKWIAGGLGWVYGGPIGGILGYALGHLWERSTESDKRRPRGFMGGPFGDSRQTTRTGPHEFFLSLLVLAAAVVRADGKITDREKGYIRSFMIQHFGPSNIEEKMQAFEKILEKEFDTEPVCRQIRGHMTMSARLQMLHFLFGISHVDGHTHNREIEVIHTISRQLGVSTLDFESIKAMFAPGLDAEYKILEVPSSATDEEVKKAYRRMALKYHPDKVAGLGQEVQEAAKEKFQAVQSAYQKIKKDRGIN